jgi:hypothetical protein
MKYLRKFNELKSSTYKSAANQLSYKGHKVRSKKLLDHSIEVGKREKREDYLNKQSNNPFLNYSENSIEGYIYQYNSTTKSWDRLGLSTAKISSIGLNTDYMNDVLFESGDYVHWPPFVKLWISFQLNLDEFNLDLDSYYNSGLPFYDEYCIDLEIGVNSKFNPYSDASAYIDDNSFVFLLTRRGLRGLNKMVKKYLTDGFGKEIKWHNKSMGNFTDSELYSVPDYLYRYFDLLLTTYIDKNEGVDGFEMPTEVIEYNENFDDYFRDTMDKLKAPKVYYRIYRDDFPENIKNLILD